MRGIVDLIAPTTCAGCGSQADGDLCAACAERVVVLREPLCPRCGGPRRGPCPCTGLAAFGRARSLVVFAEPVRALTLRLKRRGVGVTASAIGSLLAALVRRDALSGDVVTFVPAGRGRGFDHSELLARATARALDLPVARLLVRTGQGPRQADVALTERRGNVRERFAARHAPRRVLLVDDVFTTGATAEACSRSLVQAGASNVDVVTWARTLLRRHA